MVSLSPSKVIKITQCPNSYRHQVQSGKDEPNIYAAVGTSIHDTLEKVIAMPEMTPKERDAHMLRRLVEVCAEDNITLQFTPSFTQSKDFVRAWAPPKGIIESEVLHQLNLENRIFRYKIDMRVETDDALRIVDFKSSASVPDPLQLQMYAWAEHKRDGIFDRFKFIEVEYHMTRTGKIAKWVLDKSDFDKAEKVVDTAFRVAEVVKDLDDAPRIPGVHCRFCSAECEVRSAQF